MTWEGISTDFLGNFQGNWRDKTAHGKKADGWMFSARGGNWRRLREEEIGKRGVRSRGKSSALL